MPMGWPLIVSAWYRIGQARVRRTWRGKLVLQIAEGRRHGRAEPRGCVYSEGMEVRWRDASIYDLENLHTVTPIDDSDRMPTPAPRPAPPTTGSGVKPPPPPPLPIVRT